MPRVSGPEGAAREQFPAVADGQQADRVGAGVQRRQQGRAGPGIRAPGLHPAVRHLDHQFLHLPDSEAGRSARDQLARHRVPVPGCPPAGPGVAEERGAGGDLLAGLCAPGRRARWTRAAAASPGCRCRSRWGRRRRRRRRTGSSPGCRCPEPLLVQPAGAAPGGVEPGLGADRHGVLGQLADGVGIGHFHVFEAVAGGTDPLLPHFRGGQVQGVQRRIEAGVADDVEAGLDAQQRARRQVRSRLRRPRGTGCRAPPGRRCSRRAGPRCGSRWNRRCSGPRRGRSTETPRPSRMDRACSADVASSPQYGRTSGTAAVAVVGCSSRLRAAGPRCCRCAVPPSPPGPRSRWRPPRPGPAAGSRGALAAGSCRAASRAAVCAARLTWLPA